MLKTKTRILTLAMDGLVFLVQFALLLFFALPGVATQGRGEWLLWFFAVCPIASAIWLMIRLIPSARRLSDANLRTDLALTQLSAGDFLWPRIDERIGILTYAPAIGCAMVCAWAWIDGSGAHPSFYQVTGFSALILLPVLCSLEIGLIVAINVFMRMCRPASRSRFWAHIPILWSAIPPALTFGAFFVMLAYGFDNNCPLFLMGVLPGVVIAAFLGLLVRFRWRRALEQYFVLDA